MTYKYFNSKIGLVLSGFYLFVVIAIIIALAFAQNAGWFNLFPIVLTLPWSVLIFRAMHDYEIPSSGTWFFDIVGYILFVFCVFLNAAILYLMGSLFSYLIDRLSSYLGKIRD